MVEGISGVETCNSPNTLSSKAFPFLHFFCNAHTSSFSQIFTYAEGRYYVPSFMTKKPEALCKVKRLVESQGATK